MMVESDRCLDKTPSKRLTIGRRLRYYYLRFVRLKGDPHSLARGFAIGAFVGATPTIPLHTILTLALALLGRGSKIAALLGSVLVSNPLTILLQYFLAWKIGNRIIATGLSWEIINNELATIFAGAGFMESLATLGRLGLTTITTLLLGGCLLALPIAAVAYVASYQFFVAIRKKYAEKHALK